VQVLRKLLMLFLAIGLAFTTCFLILQVTMYAMLAEMMRPVPGIGEIFAFRTWEWIFGTPQEGDRPEKYGKVNPTWPGAIYTGQDGIPVGWAAEYLRITQEFGPGHGGIDLSNYTGTPIYATMKGTVVYAGWSDVGYGNLVIIQADTSAGRIETYYAHQRAIDVAPGMVVEAGRQIGEMGSTGNSTGPHLHYEVRLNGETINPRVTIPAE
jgi:murein DD-endopeptidase MepM/ murein hydrolase activator NlpD